MPLVNLKSMSTIHLKKNESIIVAAMQLTFYINSL